MAKWTDIVKGVAPLFGSLIPGPLGSAVTKVIAEAVGAPDTKPATLEAKLQSLTADELVKIKQAENDFVAKMNEQGIDLERIAAADRADARQMQMKTGSRIAPILAMSTLGILTAMVTMLCLRAIPEQNKEPFDILLGIVSTGTASVWGFYFGSSHSSQAKDATVAKLADVK